MSEESAKLSDSLKPLEAGLAARQHYRQHALLRFFLESFVQPGKTARGDVQE